MIRKTLIVSALLVGILFGLQNHEIKQLEQDQSQAELDLKQTQKQLDLIKSEKLKAESEVKALEQSRRRQQSRLKELKEKLEAKLNAGRAYAAVVPARNSSSLSQWLYRLRMCEAGGDYKKNTGNGYFGAYQFMDSTWDRWNTGYSRADLAPPAVQDATVVKNTRAAATGLASQHPGCYQKIGISAFPPES